MDSAVSLILHDKPSGILLSLRDKEKKYATVLAKENDCTYTHVLKIISELRDLGLVEFERDGRIKFVRLTSKGEDVAHAVEGLVRQLEKITVDEDVSEKEVVQPNVAESEVVKDEE